ncbi:MAG: thiamine pyrophosphate-binding protein [Steroidobacteraceae bacterium]
MNTVRITGGMVVSRALSRYGIRTVFAVAGASHTHLLDALDRDGFSIISSRHESGCVSAADGYARVTGRLGVALIIADQGMPNAINGIAAAFQACSPVLVLVARLPNSWTEAESEYDNAKHPLVTSITKSARKRAGGSPPRGVRRCRRKARTGGATRALRAADPAGVLRRESAARLGQRQQPALLAARPGADPAAIAEAARLLAAAERPLLITGAGAPAGAASREIVERFGIPVPAMGSVVASCPRTGSVRSAGR